MPLDRDFILYTLLDSRIYSQCKKSVVFYNYALIPLTLCSASYPLSSMDLLKKVNFHTATDQKSQFTQLCFSEYRTQLIHFKFVNF